MTRDTRKSIVLVALAVAVGVIGWSGNPLTLPLVFAFPALWAFSPSRLAAALVSAGYFLAASRGLPQGVINFYGSGMGAGIALWLAASAGFVFVHAMLWTARPGWVRALRYSATAILMSVPPFGIVGWAHPITAAGIVFPGWGWWGLAAAAIGLLAMVTKVWPITTLALGGAFAWSAASWTPPNLPDGWVGVDTKFGGERGEYAGFFQHRETIATVKTVAAKGYKVVVLPESAAGIWTPTVANLWGRALEETDLTVFTGAIVVDAQGYDNVMIEIAGEGSRALYRERMPVPVSMWQPWANGGANAHFFANPVVEFARVKIAPLICYEQLLVWPVLHSMLYGPEVIVATGNGWWTGETNIVAIQIVSSESWASLFGLPLVTAFNH